MLPASDLESWLAELSTILNVGMQVLEDALCNWQKKSRRIQKISWIKRVSLPI